MSTIELRGLFKSFGTTPVLKGLDLVVPDATITAVLGGSGSGKTTLLRLIAGFEQADGGTITIGGRVVDDGHLSTKPQRRGVGYVPQEGALFPHLTVIGNISFGVGRAQRGWVDELLELVGLTDLARRYPHQLSGGQQQRVALARALAIRPNIVLLDEPFSSLDATMRDGVRRDVARILHETGTTTVLVTHDQDEALALASQVAVMGDGRVIACADPRELYTDPPDLIAATSIGQANILTAVVRGHEARCVLGAVAIPATAPATAEGHRRLLLRPEQLVLHVEATDGAVAATVADAQYHGHETLVDLVVDDADHQRLLARVPGTLELATGQRVGVTVRGQGRLVAGEESEVAACPPTTLLAPADRR